jgi:hypothetical protein
MSDLWDKSDWGGGTLTNRYPPLLAAWPVELLRAVGVTYRAARGQGMHHPKARQVTLDAYAAAGGDAHSTRETVVGILKTLTAHRGRWL